jgi:carboxymethylenebutenolidase
MTNRVVTDNWIVEEAKVRMVHSKQMDWFLAGVLPTGRNITVELVMIVEFRDGTMSAERIYWDHATVLRQVGHIS